MTRFFRISLNPGFQDNLPRFVFYSGKFQKNMASHFGLLDKRMNSTTDKEQPVTRKCYLITLFFTFKRNEIQIVINNLCYLNTMEAVSTCEPKINIWGVTAAYYRGSSHFVISQYVILAKS